MAAGVPPSGYQGESRFRMYPDLTQNPANWGMPSAPPLFDSPATFETDRSPVPTHDYDNNNSATSAAGNAGLLPPHLQVVEDRETHELTAEEQRRKEAAIREWEEQQRQAQQQAWWTPPSGFVAPPIEPPVSVVRFDVTDKVAEEAFFKWVDHLWFTPTGFKKHVTAGSFKRVYIPHYIVNAVAHTTWNCETGHDHQEMHHNKQTGAEEYSTVTKWKPASGARVHSYRELQMCADQDTALLRCVGGAGHFKLEGAVSAAQPSVLAASQHYINKWASWEHVWKSSVTPYIHAHERDASAVQARAERVATHIRNLHADVYFTNVSYSMVFLPFLVSEYYETADANSARMFIVNGQTGQYSGVRPSKGLGKLGDFVKGANNFASTVFGKTEGVQLISGEALTELDNVRCYDQGAFYITMPRSNSYMVTQATGYVVLKNNGSVPMIIQTQKRRSRETGKTDTGDTYELVPGKSTAADFRGHWCIKIVRGTPSDLEVIEVAVKGGGKGNKLGMF